MKLLAILNPRAAGGRARRLAPRLERMLTASAHQGTLRVTESTSEMDAAIREGAAHGFDGLVLAGGDGTVHAALPAVRDTGMAFTVLPCGRGNDFARNAGLARSWPGEISIAPEPRYRELDLPFINGTPFASSAYFGFDAAVSRLARDRAGYFGGSLGYAICVLKALRQVRPFAVTLRVDDAAWTTRIMMMAVANGPYYGGGMCIAPGARVDDGRLDLCLVGDVSRWELVRQFPRVYRGTHVAHSAVVTASGRRIEVIANEGREIFADGEFVGTAPATIEVGLARMRVLL